MSRQELEMSRDRLERSGYRLAVGPAGERLIMTGAVPPTEAGWRVWSPEEMFNYLEMTADERRSFRAIKYGFNGSTTFRYPQPAVDLEDLSE